MTDWSLSQILGTLNDTIQCRLDGARKGLSHPGTKGDASENIWLELFQTYLPKRYQVAKAHVVDSKGNFSEQIDVVVFDRQYSPFIFFYEGQKIIPAESVYAVFEVKQSINACHIRYAQDKVASVRRLHRTSLSIPHAGGEFKEKTLIPIYGGLLTFESDWKNPALGKSLLKALKTEQEGDKHLDLGCVAAHGYFSFEKDEGYKINEQRKPTTAFLFWLISQLQSRGTVPMIDVQAYAEWLTK